MIPLLKAPVKLSEEAAKMVVQAMETEKLEGHGVRIGVTGGGCSGLQYLLDFVEGGEENNYDFIYEQHGVTVVVDGFSAAHLNGTLVEYKETLYGAGFKFVNPMITRSCGCNKSFAT